LYTKADKTGRLGVFFAFSVGRLSMYIKYMLLPYASQQALIALIIVSASLAFQHHPYQHDRGRNV